MNNFVEVTSDWQSKEGERRFLRTVDATCWISVLYRKTGFGWFEWETAIVFGTPDDSGPGQISEIPPLLSREFLIIRGDRRCELNDMPKEQLRDWYAANIDGNRNSMDTLMQSLGG